MQASVLILNLIVFVFMGFLNSTAFSGDYEEMTKYYENCIFREIEKCSSKLILLGDSKSENLQDYVRIKAKKLEFLAAEQDRLIEEMINIKFEPKNYKIDLFLNSRFQEWYRYRN